MQMVIDVVLRYWVGWLNSILAALIALMYRRVIAIKKQQEANEKENKKKDDAICDALVALMRDRIFQACRYHLKDGYVKTGDLEVLNALYESYHTLGGDTIATKLVERVNNLKIMIDELH